MKNNRDIQFNYNVIDANKSFFYVILTNITASLVFGALMMVVNLLAIMGLSDNLYNFVASILQVILIPCSFILIISIYHKNRRINIKTSTNFDWKINPIILLLCVAILVVCVVSFFPIINMIYSAIELIGLDMSSSVAFPMNNWWQLLIGVVIYCLLPAIAEEILFRGMMLKGILSKAKPIVAITLSSIAFFIMHGSLIQSFYQIILGFLLGIIGYYTKNIFYPIIFHFLNNLTVVLLNYFSIGGFLNGFQLSFGGFMAGLGIAVVGAGVIVAIILLIRHLMKNNNEYEFVVNENNIIVEEKQEKLGFREYVKSLSIDEKYYFHCAWVFAIFIWLFNSF